MIDKWLKAGAVEGGLLRPTIEGSPQRGGDLALSLERLPASRAGRMVRDRGETRLRGTYTLVRYADDALMEFDNVVDAQPVLSVLGKRLTWYGLTLHPDKTRLVDVRPKKTEGACHLKADGASFDFLGLTHFWGRSRNGKDIARQVTAKSRFARAAVAVNDWCRGNRHRSVRDQNRHLSSMMRGHFAYYGVGDNSRRMCWFANQVVQVWRKWLFRCDRQEAVSRARFNERLARHPLPSVKIIHGYAAASESLS
jgi:RNA-directed DNA polymerase